MKILPLRAIGPLCLASVLLNMGLTAHAEFGVRPNARPLNVSHRVRGNCPNSKLKPLQFVTGDAGRESMGWAKKAADLLAAKRYDEIEKVAAQLQKSKVTNVKGTALLSTFFDGLTKRGENDFSALQNRIAAWRRARPQSNLARLAEIDMWTNAAQTARGEGFASTVTPAMSAKMDAALAKSAQRLRALPRTAFKSPLAFTVALHCALLSSAPREALDSLFMAGKTRFPDYQPLYRSRALHLLPRWFGEPGETEAMLAERANRIGGEDGDIFYGRLVWYLAQIVGQTSQDFSYDYDRAQRGLTLLQRRHPDSVSVLSARVGLAFIPKNPGDRTPRDLKTLRQILNSPRGHILDSAWRLWSTPESQSYFAQQRAIILGKTLR